MENGELFNLIESYLENSLPEEQRSEVEHRMANDESFRREVQLHRELQANLSDPVRWRLRSTMQEVMKEPLSSVDSSLKTRPALLHKLWKWFILLAAVFIGIGLWAWLKPSADESLKDPIEVLPSTEPSAPLEKAQEGETNDDIQETSKEPGPAQQQPGPPLQIAQADPDDFIPNPSMEALVNSGYRSHNDLSLKLTNPVNNAVFFPNSKGVTSVRFAGGIEGVSVDSPISLTLNVFNNNDVANPLLSELLEVKAESGVADFNVRQEMSFPLGLYYFIIEQDGEFMYAGKFAIGAPDQ